MKKRHLLLIVLFMAVALSCLLGQRAIAKATQGPTAAPGADDDYDRRVKEYEAGVQRQEAQEKRGEALLTREEALIKRQEDDFQKYEKILATWERQQQEYQRYLDTLPKK